MAKLSVEFAQIEVQRSTRLTVTSLLRMWSMIEDKKGRSLEKGAWDLLVDVVWEHRVRATGSEGGRGMNLKERHRFEFVVQWWVGEHAAERVTEIFDTIDSMSSAKDLKDDNVGAVVLENWPTWLAEFEKAYNDTPLAKWMFSFSDTHYYRSCKQTWTPGSLTCEERYIAGCVGRFVKKLPRYQVMLKEHKADRKRADRAHIEPGGDRCR